MNDQSSRSHAIFSLTLTQRKYVGQGTPQMRSTDSSPSLSQSSTFGTPSRNSVIRNATIQSRVASPTPNSTRPNTPGDNRNSRLIPRPSSALGRAPSPNSTNKEDDEKTQSPMNANENEWTTVISKFHFVDLAGSERVSFIILLGLGATSALDGEKEKR